ncbi:MAG: NADH-quinone oxidoreductase subunit C [Deltaproteobacteria bacterium]|nr:MAG: NADH-quinone oxidoreductase subunit C [Deltaproteobacteria bacterium]
MAERLLDLLLAELPDAVVEVGSYLGDEIALVHRDRVRDVLTLLRDHESSKMDMLVDLTVVDYLGQSPRFEVVYHLRSTTFGHRLRVKAGVPEDDPTIASVADLWKSANWSEREAWDLYGVRFEGHPDLRRILMYGAFEGHPLRKDYPQNARQPLVRRPDAPPTDELTTRLRLHSHDRRVE